MQFRIAALADHVRSVKDPNNSKIKIVHAYVNVHDLPLEIPIDPDPRAPKITGPVPQRILCSLKSNDGKFHLKNRGITISAKQCDFDNSENILKLHIPQDDQFGILDGAHTYECIKQAVSGGHGKRRTGQTGSSTDCETEDPQERKRPFGAQYVHLEVLSRIENDLADIAEARNFSVALKAWTLANYRDKFDWLLEALGKDFTKSIIRVSENDPQPIGILDVIQIISAVNPELFPEEKPALDAYKNSGKMLQSFIAEGDIHKFKMLAPVCRDILRLHDHVRLNFKKQYNAPDESGRRGKFGRTNVAQEAKDRRNSKSKTTYYFLDRMGGVVTGDEPIDKGFSIPLISGFRVLLEEKEDGFHWLTDPFVFFDAYGSKLVWALMNASNANDNDPHVVGRDARVYQQLTSEVRRWYLESKYGKKVTANPQLFD